MIDNYEMIEPGHWFQSKPTGEIMKYDTRYIEYYTKMSDTMSKLRFNLLDSYLPLNGFNSICDFGYGDGNFLKCVKKQNKDFLPEIKLYGHDISNYPLPEGITFIKDIKDIDVDVTTFFDSIEHIPERNIHELLGSIKTKYIMISLPWMHERMGAEWFRTWKHRKENEHFHHFDSHGLITLVHKAGFTPIHLCNHEDEIRKSVSYLPNILTIIAKRN
jgi:hypothetical protein